MVTDRAHHFFCVEVPGSVYTEGWHQHPLPVRFGAAYLAPFQVHYEMPKGSFSAPLEPEMPIWVILSHGRPLGEPPTPGGPLGSQAPARPWRA